MPQTYHPSEIYEPDLTIEPVQYPYRKVRAGSYESFVKRYDPWDTVTDGYMIDSDRLPAWVSKGNYTIFRRYIWTICDEDGQLYAFPGFRFVNRISYAIGSLPWHDSEQENNGYRF